MYYRDGGQYKTTYKDDLMVFPLREDRIGICAIIFISIFVIPIFGSDFLLNAVMTPILVYALATIGLNLLVGYAGQLSLGTGAFMGVGAYACYKMTTLFPNVSILIWILCSGFFSAAIGTVFGLPSVRIKGFYLAVATLAAQFFLSWCFVRIAWLYNYNVSGAIEVPSRTVLNLPITGPEATSATRYLVVLGIVALLTWIASNLTRGRIGRMWMAVRDMHIAAELIGIRLAHAKLLAFAVSSYYCGVAGALMVFLWYGGAEANSFDINQSFFILFMVIIGGRGSLVGSYFGAAVIFGLPIFIRVLPSLFGFGLESAAVQQITFVVVGALVIAILAIEPNGLARLWQIGKHKLREWPFP